MKRIKITSMGAFLSGESIDDIAQTFRATPPHLITDFGKMLAILYSVDPQNQMFGDCQNGDVHHLMNRTSARSHIANVSSSIDGGIIYDISADVTVAYVPDNNAIANYHELFTMPMLNEPEVARACSGLYMVRFLRPSIFCVAVYDRLIKEDCIRAIQ